MKISFMFFVLAFAFTSLSVSGQDDPVERGLNSITTDAVKAQMGFLASDWTEGREAGEKGEYLSGDYIASMLQLYGVKPGGDLIRSRDGSGSEKSYFQNFTLIKSIPSPDQEFQIKSSDGGLNRTYDLANNVDFRIPSVTVNAEIEAPVVFVGYGLKSDKLQFNELEKADLRGKFVLKINTSPRFAGKKFSANELINAQREGENYIRAQGAAGIILFNPSVNVAGSPEPRDFNNMSPSEGRPSTGRPRARFSIPGGSMGDDFIRIEISARAANEILRGTGLSVNDYIKQAATGKPMTIPPLAGKSIYLRTRITSSQVAVRNIIGVVEGKDTEQVIVVGAHYDHMGIGNGYVWNGADDNASGTVGVMTLARALMASGTKPEKTVVFALWTAEEVGLLGSRYFVRNPTYPINNLKLNINFDMISRYISDDKPNDVVMTYTRSYPVFKDITVRGIKDHRIDLIIDYQPSDDPPGGTDHRSFVEVKVPVIRFKPGHREEYHTPYDEIGTIDWDIMEKIIKINFVTLYELANTRW